MSVEVGHWRGARAIPPTPLEGRYARVEMLDMRRHGQDLWDAFGGSGDAVSRHLQHTGLPAFDRRETFFRSMTKANRATLPDLLVKPFRRRKPRRLYFACIDKANGRATGLRCLAQIDYVHGSVELALMAAGRGMTRTRLSTEVAFLMATLVFETSGFRRYECHIALENEHARRAAERIGWHHDGVMRQRYVHDGRSADVAVYTILAQEWPPIRDAYRAWLEPSNFDSEGRQIRRLEDFRS
ncbi:N-acetyltransferase [Aquibium carbonis]|uniref:N-acetyltransferase n=1 Tax=Aquibium carbonis TaxID=2495581 RepID=A0A3S0A267_9HYPH|nr:GNAT family protein [Aquibium carbonis]RST83113.1 N-acetyltransferase [Aquibium carbonis]